MFTLAADAQQRIKNFRSERIATIVAGRGPVPLANNGRLFVHLVPLSAFGQAAPIDLERAYKSHQKFEPLLPSMGITARFNLDGVINIRGGEERYGYAQVFRNGIVEATCAGILDQHGGITFLRASGGIDRIVEVLPSYFEGLQALDVPAPIVVMISYEGVAGARLVIRHDLDPERREPFPPVDPLLLPEVIIDDYGSREDYVRELRPIFDALWNAAGFARCTHYDADGNWRPPHR